MLIIKETVRFINEQAWLSGEKRRALTRIIRGHHNNVLKLVRWIKSLIIFVGPGYRGLLSFQRIEIVKRLNEGLMGEDRSKDLYKELLCILLGEDSESQEDEALRALSAHVLSTLRWEPQFKAKAHLVELLVRLPNEPSAGLQADDLQAGLHHEDEVVRCRVLMFVYRLFKADGLRVVVQEVKGFHRPPSLLFRGTLRHFIHQHPEILRDSDCRPLLCGELQVSAGFGPQNPLDMNCIEQRHPGWRLGVRVACMSIDAEDAWRGIERKVCRRNGSQSLYTDAGLIRAQRLQSMGCTGFRVGDG